MTTTTTRPWLASYGDVAPDLATTSGSILDAFRATVSRDPDATLVRYFDTAITAREIDDLTDALAVALQRRGILAGDRIAMYLQNVPQAMLTMLAAWKAGAVVVPCNPMLKGRELAKILSDSGSKAIVLHDDLYADIAAPVLADTAVEFAITTSGLDFLPDGETPASLRGLERRPSADTEDLLELAERHRGEEPEPVDLTSDDVAFMVYTSGTTGAPKGAMNTHGNGFFAASVYQHWMRLGSDTVILGLAPTFHVTGLTGQLVLSMISGAQLLLFYRFDAETACRLTQTYHANFAVTAITAFTALLGSTAIESHDMSSLVTVYTGGAPTPTTVIDEWRSRVGSAIHPMYGLTEVTSPATMTPLGAVYRSDPASGVVSIGVPVPNTAIRILTDAGTEAAAREIGELRISGPQVVPGYWQLPDETSKSFEDGELRTGDIGFMDEDGWIYLVDRAKDMIVASGFKVWPSEVEEVLYQHPAIREAGVVGVPDPYRGETVMAFVSLKPGMDVRIEELKAFARERMAAYKYPRVIEIIDDLPKTSSGKIMRRLLQDMVGAPAVVAGTEDIVAGIGYPEVREAIETRTVLEIGGTWLRLSQGAIPPREAAALYECLHDLLATIEEGGVLPDRPAFLAANESFHSMIVDLLGNDHLSRGFRHLEMRSLFERALAGSNRTSEDVVAMLEQLMDSIAAGSPKGTREAVLAWAESSRQRIQVALKPHDREEASTRWTDAALMLSAHSADETAVDFSSDVDALLSALEARAAIEIGVTQLLVSADTTRPDRARFVARLKAAIPLVRGTDSAHAARYTRADDTFHRIVIGLLQNERLIDLYNRIDLPEVLFRVLEASPVPVRDALDNYQALTAALLEDEADAACQAIAAHMLEVRAALTKAVAAQHERKAEVRA